MAIKNNDIDFTLKGKKTDDLDFTLQGVTTLHNDLPFILRGVTTVNDDLDFTLKGKRHDDLDFVLVAKPYDDLAFIINAIDPPDIFSVYDFIEDEMLDSQITSGRLINEVSIKYAYDYAEQKYKAAITKHNPLSKLLYQDAPASMELNMIQKTRQAERIADAVLLTSSIPEIICTFTHNQRSIYVEVGDIVTITHKAGLVEGGYVLALGTVSRKNVRGIEIDYEVVMKTTTALYRTELITLSQVAAAGAPGITITYDQGVATITIYADVQGYPPVEGAEVTISGVKKLTGKKGQARFNLDPGTYTAIITASGYEDAEITFTV